MVTVVSNGHCPLSGASLPDPEDEGTMLLWPNNTASHPRSVASSVIPGC